MAAVARVGVDQRQTQQIFWGRGCGGESLLLTTRIMFVTFVQAPHPLRYQWTFWFSKKELLRQVRLCTFQSLPPPLNFSLLSFIIWKLSSFLFNILLRLCSVASAAFVTLLSGFRTIATLFVLASSLN